MTSPPGGGEQPVAEGPVVPEPFEDVARVDEALPVVLTERAHHLLTVPLGVLQTEADRVQGFQEKPTVSWQTNAGIYVVSPEVCARVRKGKPFQMPELIVDCLDRGEVVAAHPIEDDWIDVGRAGELNRARAGE